MNLIKTELPTREKRRIFLKPKEETMMKDVGRKRPLEGDMKGGNGRLTNALIKGKTSSYI